MRNIELRAILERLPDDAPVKVKTYISSYDDGWDEMLDLYAPDFIDGVVVIECEGIHVGALEGEL